MKIKCVWEHNGNDTILYAENFVGAYARGESREIALEKMKREAERYARWAGAEIPQEPGMEIVQEKASDLQIRDADSDVLFDAEKEPLTKEEYEKLKALALKSARDFQRVYEQVPDKQKSVLPHRKTFYGEVPRTAQEMYEHTKNVNAYYFAEISVDADNEGTIVSCRERGFLLLEQQDGYLENKVYHGSYDEQWTLRKVLRRFVWHDRIHAKAMYRMAQKTFGDGAIADVFGFR